MMASMRVYRTTLPTIPAGRPAFLPSCLLSSLTNITHKILPQFQAVAKLRIEDEEIIVNKDNMRLLIFPLVLLKATIIILMGA